jgi:TRAP-type C4-dicarboxylate transport system substrate-binding protein
MSQLSNFLVGVWIASGVVGTAQAETWDLPTPYPEATFHTDNIQQFAEDVERASEGRLAIRVHSAGSLFRHPEIKNAVRSGQVPIGEFLLSRLANQNPIFETDAVPFLATDYGQAERLWALSRPEISRLLASEGLMVLFSVPWPPQALYADRQVESIDDLRGLRFRAYNTATERLAQLAGALPTQVEVTDIPQAFATGRVQAMITSPSTGANAKAWDFVDHFYHTQAWLPKNVVVVNRRAFERLDPVLQGIVRGAATAAERRGWAMSRVETDTQIAVLRDHGMLVADPGPELAADLREIGRTMADEWVRASGPAAAAIVEALSARSDS